MGGQSNQNLAQRSLIMLLPLAFSEMQRSFMSKLSEDIISKDILYGTVGTVAGTICGGVLIMIQEPSHLLSHPATK